MKHLRPRNQKAQRIEQYLDRTRQADVPNAIADESQEDVVALQAPSPPKPKMHVPMGCTFIFTPGWEVDSAGGAAGLCQPLERDIYDCYVDCYWPAQVPDHLNNKKDWASKCASATKDWRDLDLVFP